MTIHFEHKIPDNAIVTCHGVRNKNKRVVLTHIEHPTDPSQSYFHLGTVRLMPADHNLYIGKSLRERLFITETLWTEEGFAALKSLINSF